MEEVEDGGGDKKGDDVKDDGVEGDHKEEGLMNEVEEEEEEDVRCGMGSWRPAWLQKLARGPIVVALMICIR